MNAKKSSLSWKSVRTSKKLEHPIDWDRFVSGSLPKPKKEDMHEKWMVVTTISEPTEDVKKLAQVKGWKLLIVGDKKTPEPWQ